MDCGDPEPQQDRRLRARGWWGATWQLGHGLQASHIHLLPLSLQQPVGQVLETESEALLLPFLFPFLLSKRGFGDRGITSSRTSHLWVPSPAKAPIPLHLPGLPTHTPSAREQQVH